MDCHKYLCNIYVSISILDHCSRKVLASPQPRRPSDYLSEIENQNSRMSPEEYIYDEYLVVKVLIYKVFLYL